MNNNQVVNLNQLGIKPNDYVSFNPNCIVDTMLKHECLGEAIHRALNEKEKYIYGKVKDLQVVYPNFGYICTPNHLANFGWNVLSRLCFVSEENKQPFCGRAIPKTILVIQFSSHGLWTVFSEEWNKEETRWALDELGLCYTFCTQKECIEAMPYWFYDTEKI